MWATIPELDLHANRGKAMVLMIGKFLVGVLAHRMRPSAVPREPRPITLFTREAALEASTRLSEKKPRLACRSEDGGQCDLGSATVSAKE